MVIITEKNKKIKKKREITSFERVDIETMALSFVFFVLNILKYHKTIQMIPSRQKNDPKITLSRIVFHFFHFKFPNLCIK